MTDSPSTTAAVTCPPSATHGLVAASGFTGFVGGVFLLGLFHPFQNIAYSALAVMACTALGVFVPDLLWQKVQWRALSPEAGAGDWRRALTKFAGLLGSLGFLALLYWSFPEYYKPDPFYKNYWAMLSVVLPVWLVLALPYIYWVDRHMPEPHDSLWQMGCFVTVNWQEIHLGMLGQHLLGWLVKGFFLPLMFAYMCTDLGKILSYDFGRIDSFKAVYDFTYLALYFADVGLVCMTYLISLRLTDTHIRSSEPTMMGWITAIICYQPFYSLISRQYFDYDSGGKAWGDWMSGQPELYALWGTLILVAAVIYLWATIAFGGRFSNLTHRGIITNGPYRYSKHPAYLAKNLSWWLISMPFMIAASEAETIRHCLLLLMLNMIYYLRAKTEERHLALDPVYVEYAKWIDAHGLLRFLNRMPLIRHLASWRPPFGQRPLGWVWADGVSSKGAAPENAAGQAGREKKAKRKAENRT